MNDVDELPDDGLNELLASQRRFYDLRAPDFADVTKLTDRKHRGLMPTAEVRAIVDDFAPAGDVLELACGAGGFTRDLLRHTDTLTAVDGSARMLELNREIVGDPAVEYRQVDLFDWSPDRTYDAVFFGFWLSHVPPSRFESFWTMVAACLRPGGRVGFVDEDPRARAHELAHSNEGVPTATRRLPDGTPHDIVKVFWDPSELQERLTGLGWHATVRATGASFYVGNGGWPANSLPTT